MPTKLSELSVITPASGDTIALTDVSNSNASGKATIANVIAAASPSDLGAAPVETVVTESGTTRTMADADAGRTVRCTNASGCTVTVPSGLTAGVTTTYVAEHATGDVSFVGSGLTLRFAATFSATSREQWASVVVRILDTDEALVTGVLADA